MLSSWFNYPAIILTTGFFIALNHDPQNEKIKKFILKEIELNHIDLPQCLKIYANKNNIRTLADLLALEPKPILRSRNLGKTSLIKAQRVILSYLCENKECLASLYKKLEDDDIYYSDCIKKYYPLLQGIYKTSEFYYNFINKDVSYIKIPKRIKAYIKKKTNIATIEDVLNISYNDLISIDNIGVRTIKTLQYTLIELLCLEKVISVPSSLT